MNCPFVHRSFEEQAARTPESRAAIFQEDAVSYRELNVRANGLAHFLRDHGAGAGTSVGVCLSPSIRLLVGVLAALKAGGTYVPMDPSHPKERRDFMLRDAQVKLVLTEERWRFGFDAVRSLCLDADEPMFSGCGEENLPAEASEKDPAAVIYTSGSTGMPKGVVISHANLADFVDAVRSVFGVAVGDAYLHSTPIAHMMAFRQTLAPLCLGATVVVATPDEVRDAVALFRLIRRRRVTMMDFVPSHWHACIQALSALDKEDRAELLRNELRQIVCVGERLPSAVPRKWAFEFRHPARLFNIFGQTETTRFATFYEIPPQRADSCDFVPIGKAAPGTAVHILGEDLAPVPDGVAGELHVAGRGVSLGYLHRPDLTAAKFIPDPFSREPGARLCKTGDLARRLPDGNIEHLGRMDEQAKIRGFRVEPGEIEARLLQHPAVESAAVCLRNDRAGSPYLAAYVVPRQRGAETTGEQVEILRSRLWSFLSERLPDHMIPAAFVALGSLPLTPGGKIDRRALPDPRGAERAEDVSDWFFVPVWKHSPLAASDAGDLLRRKSRWLLFVDACGLGERVADKLRARGQEVVVVSGGREFAEDDGHRFAIDIGRREDYGRLFERLRSAGRTPERILHLAGVTGKGGEETEAGILAAGFHSLVFLAQAIGEGTAAPASLTVVSDHAQDVNGGERLCPFKSTISGPCRVIPIELGFACGHVDVVLPEEESELEDLAERLLFEAAAAQPEIAAALRGRERWVRAFERAELREAAGRPSLLRERGVYLITGGLGEIGLEIARCLAETVRARLALTARSEFPDRCDWDAWLAAHGEGDPASSRMRKLRAMELAGGEILIVRADVSDPEQMRRAFERARERFGAIHGVVHSAGVRGVFEPIRERAPETAARVFAPKIAGTLALDAACKDEKPDFVLLCSSLASILGRSGQIDYCAANAFLDAFARRRVREGARFVSVNWPSWRETGTKLKSDVPQAFRELLERQHDAGISSQGGIEAFLRILGNPLPQVAVSPRNLANFGRRSAAERERAEAPDTLSDAPGTEVETFLAGLWKQILHVGRVGAHDDFFALGGHSLSAMQVIAHVLREYHVELSISRHFFDAKPTIANLASAILAERMQGDAGILAELEAIERLSEDDADKLLAKEREDRRGKAK